MGKKNNRSPSPQPLPKQQKGTQSMCALLVRMCESPPCKSDALAQCRKQHYVLDSVVPRYFHFPRTLCELTTRIASGYPKLGQEIPISVAMKNQLGLFRSVAGFAALRQYNGVCFLIRTANRDGRPISHPLDGVLTGGQRRSANDKIERNIGFQIYGLGVSGRPHQQTQAQ